MSISTGIATSGPNITSALRPLKGRRRSSALSTLQELAALPHPCNDSLSAVAGALSSLVPFDGAALNLLDSDSDVTDFIGDGMFNEALFTLFVENFYDTPAEDALGGSCRSLIGLGRATASTEKEDRWLDSPLYRDAFRPYGIEHVTRVFLRRGSLPTGVLLLGRSPGREALLAHEERDLHAVVPLLEQIVGRFAEKGPAEAHHLVEEATWVAAASGAVEMSSPQANRLAAMAYGLGGRLPAHRHRVAAWLKGVFRELARSPKTARELVVERRNGFGFFQFRAEWLQPVAHRRGRFLSIRLSHYVPLEARLFQSSLFQALPRREKHTVLALARGASTQETGEHLGVAPSTVLTWVRSLYQRFDVNRRSDLIDVLLHDAAGGAQGALRV